MTKIIGLTAVFFMVLAPVAFAQNDKAPSHASHKAHARKAASTDSLSEDWSIAEPNSSGAHKSGLGEDPNTAAGRKKFFEQSTTMDNNGGGGTTGSGSSSFTPSVGMSF